MLQMVRETAHTSDALDQPPSMLGPTRFMQCRLPVALYEWLRLSAFVERTSMNSIVLKAIEELQAASPEMDLPLGLKETAGTSGGVKFNVRLTEAVYEWLRTKAFKSRGSINQLLIAALEAHRRDHDNLS